MKCYKILLLLITTQICASLEISSKLDFGGAKLISTNTHHDVPVAKHASKREETKDDFDDIGVVCVLEGCNKTKTGESSEDSLKTDVVVHVVTSVDVKKNKTNFVDDTPDVPVVIGVAGTKPDHGTEQIYGIPKFSPPVITADTYSIPDTYSESYSGINNVNTLPHLTGEIGYDKRRPNHIRYTNGLEIDSPHFVSSHNYFGENLPPQLPWYPSRRPGTFNPVEFKNVPKTTWDLSYWNRKITPTFSYKTPIEATKTSNCECKYHQGTGLQWQPRNVNFNNNKDSGTQIDDKLAPLN